MTRGRAVTAARASLSRPCWSQGSLSSRTPRSSNLLRFLVQSQSRRHITPLSRSSHISKVPSPQPQVSSSFLFPIIPKLADRAIGVCGRRFLLDLPLLWLSAFRAFSLGEIEQNRKNCSKTPTNNYTHVIIKSVYHFELRIFQPP